MSEGFGIVVLLGALLGPAPPIQQPKSTRPPIQRPQEPVSTEPEPVAEPQPPPEPGPPETSSAPELSDADKAAELDEFTEILEPLPPEPKPKPKPKPKPQSTRRASPRLDHSDIVRRGFVLSPAVGATLCGHDWCDAYRGGFGGQLELGIRFGTLMPQVSVDGGSGSDDTSTLDKQLGLPRGTIDSSRTTFFGVGGGLSVFFNHKGRLDPYASTRLGYTRTVSLFSVGNAQYKEVVSRGSVRLGGGLDVFIGRNVSVGPRFDVTIGFAGRVCVEAENTGATQGGLPSSDAPTCYSTRNIEETARIYAQELPVPVFIGGQLRVTIPFHGRAAP